MTPESVTPVTLGPQELWLCPFFESILETIRSHLDVDRSSKVPGPDATVYTLEEEGFMPTDRFWISYIQPDRMDREANVLYRPQIVSDLVQRVEYLLARNEERGIMVKGPQGVGKSFSLINLTRYLLASGKYLVTIIPNCNHWRHEYFFFKFLLESVGVAPNQLGIGYYDEITVKDLKDLISDIDQLLNKKEMRWVFVFDQINEIFARAEFMQTQDVTKLPFPFSMIKEFLKPGRIISIISSPENNHESYRKNHPGFEDFEHPVQLERDEIQLLYPSEYGSWWEKWDDLEYSTGCVPLYFVQWAAGSTRYLGHVSNDIEDLLWTLQRKQCDDWDSIVSSAIQCILHLSSDAKSPAVHFDRKYSLLQVRTKKVTIVPLCPFIATIYCEFFWKDLMKYISFHESTLLNICADPSTTQNVRLRLFEFIVLARVSPNGFPPNDLNKILRAADVDNTNDDDFQAALQGRFFAEICVNQSYVPLMSSLFRDTAFVILLVPNYYSVNFMIRVGTVVVAFQNHITENQRDMLPSLQCLVQKMQWGFNVIQTMILVYLSPHDSITRNLQRKHEMLCQPLSSASTFSINATIKYVALYFSINDFTCLAHMPWTPVGRFRTQTNPSTFQ